MYKVKVNNIPHWISEIHLKQFFHSCGKIAQAIIVLNPNTLRPVGHGYVIFAEELGLQNALAKDGSKLDGVAISVEIANESEDESLATQNLVSIEP